MNFDTELKTYLQVMWRHKWMIIVCAVIALAISLSFTFVLPPSYSAIATLRLTPPPGATGDMGAGTWSTRMSNTYVEIANSNTIIDELRARLSLPPKPNVRAELIPETQLLKITASNPDPVLARDIANTLAGIMVDQGLNLYGGGVPTSRQILESQLRQARSELDTATAAYEAAKRNLPAPDSATVPNGGSTNPQLDDLRQAMNMRQDIYSDLLQRYNSTRINEQPGAVAVTVFEAAILPKEPASPKKSLNGALGLVGGLVVGLALAFVMEGMDGSIRSVEDLQSLITLPVLGQVPNSRRRSGRRGRGLAIYQRGRNSPESSFHQLRVRLLLSEMVSKPASILVTSAEPGAGKSTVAANLAVALAQAGHRVVVMDMDVRRPRVHSILNLPLERGMSEVLRGECSLDEAVKDTPLPKLNVLTAGRTAFVPAEWMTPAELGPLVRAASSGCDYLIIDAPALLSVADPAVLATVVDSVILVAALRHTERRHLRLAVQSLGEVSARVSGIVVNKAPQSRLTAYYEGRASGLAEQPQKEKMGRPNDRRS